MTDAHHDRTHDEWSASATARNVTCAGAIAMETIAPPQSESEAAAWGTCCHQIAERAFEFPHICSIFIGEIHKIGEHEITVDEEMADAAQEYVDYCRARMIDYNLEIGHPAQIRIERKFSFAELNPPFQAGGTGDCVMYFPVWKTIEIVDLKGGRGVVVEAKNNFQARSYGLGAMLEFKDLDVEYVKSTIVQPRAPHPDGRIRSETIHVADLVDWTFELLASMRQSRRALDEFEALDGNSVLFDEWAEKWLTAGHCTFCPAKAICPKLKKQALAVAGVWFDDLDKPHIGNAVPIQSPEALGKTLDGLEMLEDWIKAVRADAHRRAENGEKIPGWQLVEKIGNRTWIDTEMTPIRLAMELAVPFEQVVVEPKLKSPAQIEKLLGGCKDELAKLEGVLWHKPVKGTNLVSALKTTRARAKSKPETFFDQVEN